MKEVTLFFRKRGKLAKLRGRAHGGTIAFVYYWCLCKLLNPSEKQFGDIYRDLKIRFSPDTPVIPLLTIYQSK